MKTLEQIPEIPESGIIIRKEGALVRVFFDIAKAPVPEIEGEESSHPEDLCECYTVDVAAPATYGSVIAAIVNDRYTTDDVRLFRPTLSARLTLPRMPTRPRLTSMSMNGATIRHGASRPRR